MSETSTLQPNLRAQRPWRFSRLWLIALLPLLLVVYGFFFFDLHLKLTLQKFASQMNGAPVVVKSLRSSFRKAEIALSGIAILNPSNISQNLAEIDEVRFSLSWDALLRKKINIPEMEIKGVRYGTERGEDEAAASIEQRFGVKGLFERVASGLYAQVREELNENPLRYMATLSQGLNLANQVEIHQKTLTSLQKIQELRAQVETEQNLIESGRSPASLSDLQGKVEHIDGELARLDTLITADVQKLKANLRLPNFEKSDLTAVLLGPTLLTYNERLTYWIDLSRRRVNQSAGRSKAAPWQTRGNRGTSVAFGKLTAYPTFWLGKVSIHSELKEDDPELGYVVGQILNITSDPVVVGKPIEIKLVADFPAQAVSGLKVEGFIDHTGEAEKEEIHLSIDSFPIRRLSLTDTAELKFEIKEAKGRFRSDTIFKDNDMRSYVELRLTESQYKVASHLKSLERTLSQIVEPLRTFDLTSHMDGPFENLKFSARSELGEQLAVGLRNEFKHPMGAIEDDLRKNILDKVHPEREKVRARLERVRSLVAMARPVAH